MIRHSSNLTLELPTMRDYQQDFLDFALHHGVLRFGEFTLKSGESGPYFFNAGLFNSGAALASIRPLLRRRDHGRGSVL